MAVDVAPLIARYADRFHRAVFRRAGDTPHHVGSPLGAWLLLALAAPAALGRARDELADILGADVDSARDVAARLLERPHPAVAAAAAAWLRPAAATRDVARWLHGLPAPVERGDLPTQAQADDWAKRHTSGLIDTFPIAMDERLALVLASALATRVSWEVPFTQVASSELGNSPWAGRVRQVLRSPERHAAFIAVTERAGDVAVHTAASTDGLAVTSVIAERRVARADVVAAAHEIACGSRRRRSLFDLPLVERPLWTIEERPGSGERHVAVLPAWSARNDHDLGVPGLGFDRAGDSLAALLPPDDYRIAARQSALASYTRTGFEAAAVTAFGVPAGALRREDGRQRTATLRFGHPYAAVAVVQGGGDWQGVPVFSAWVAEPDEPS